jgi:hypothetical protein
MSMKMNEKELREYYEKVKNREHRYQVKTRLLLQKAVAAGITVTEAEIDAAIKARS